MKQISRQAHTGLAIETTRGTFINPSFWLPRMSWKHDEKVQKVVDESSVGVIEDAIDSDVVQKYSEGEIGGRLEAESIGVLLKLLFGSSTSGAVSGQAGAYDHTFSVLQSAQHPTFSLGVKDANTGNGFAYTLSSLEEFSLEAEINKYASFKMKYRGNARTSATLSPSYSANQRTFLPQNITLKMADNVAGLSGATAMEVKKVALDFKKNIEDDQVLGNINAVDRLNKQFVCEGSFEVIKNDYSNEDLLNANASKVLEFALTNSSTIGVSTNPSIKFTIYKVELDEVANKQDNNGFAVATMKFKAFYSLADAKSIQAVVRNTTASY